MNERETFELLNKYIDEGLISRKTAAQILDNRIRFAQFQDQIEKAIALSAVVAASPPSNWGTVVSTPPDIVGLNGWLPDHSYDWNVEVDRAIEDINKTMRSIHQPIDHSRFPHTCPRCGAPAYVGFSSVDCSRAGCR